MTLLILAFCILSLNLLEITQSSIQMKIYSFIIIFLLLSIEIQIVAQETPDKTKKKESPFFLGR